MTGARLLLLDSASLYFRAFYGVPDNRADPSQPPNNAIRGFLDMIATLVSTWQPSHLVACWDADWRPAFRVEAIASYKAHRLASDGSSEEVPDLLSVQVPVIAEALAACGLARFGAPGFEADDVIGSYASAWRGRASIDIVTGDRDLFQLVDDAAGIRVLYTAKGGVREPDMVDQGYLRRVYGVDSGQAYADLAVLRGDSSDGLPGVKGIGEKTAAALIDSYGTLSSLRAAVEGGDPLLKGARRANLEAAAGYLEVAPSVVQVRTDVPLPADEPALPHSPTDPEALSRLVARYDLSSPVNRLLTALHG